MKFPIRSVGSTIAVLLLLSACGGLEKSAEDQINAALPVGTELIAAKSSLDALAKTLALDTKDLQQEYAARMKVRALECGHGFQPSAFDSESSVRDKLTDKPCFAEADRKLLAWLGQRRIGMLLSAPPLRALPKTAPPVIVTPEFITEINFAARAGVAIVQSQRAYRVIDLLSGGILYAGENDGSPSLALTPNGRMFVTSRDGTAEVRESETGALLAEYPDVKPWEFFWIDNIGAVFTPKRPQGGFGAPNEPVFLDFTSGELVPLAIGGTLTQIFPRPDHPGHFIAVSWQRMAEITLTKESGNWKVRLLTVKPLNMAGMARNTSGLTSDGRTLYSTSTELKLLTLDTLEEHTLPFHPMRVQGALATADANVLLLTGFFPGNFSGGVERLLYSLSRHTFAVVDKDRMLSQRLIYIPSLRSNAVVDGSKLVMIDAIPANTPVAVDSYLERREQEVATYARAHAQDGRSDFLMPQAPMMESMALARARALERMQRENNIPDSQMAQMRALHKINDALWAQAKQANAMPLVPASSSRPGASVSTYAGPVLALAKNADIEAVGVYEASPIHMKNGLPNVGNVLVRVRASSRPIILSLSSYEPVRWTLVLEQGAKLAAVLSSGYNTSEVIGAGNARVYQLGRMYAYERGSSQFENLNAEITRWTGKPIDVFQGRYSGDSFTVGK